ncbi:hypothetical protein [Streptomyces sp. B6B3]|uniref:hypothetical protein n=1 Tax=Streptomyces sp. B6B3 TaxID=3153570 RepID=UPI00325E8DF3
MGSPSHQALGPASHAGPSGPGTPCDRHPAADRDQPPAAARARPSYRRAEEIFEENTRLLANPLAWTLHRLRHSALTHDAEGGTSTPTLLARSLERYARPGVDAVARHVAERPCADALRPRRCPRPALSKAGNRRASVGGVEMIGTRRGR